MSSTIWHSNTEVPENGADILCIGHNSTGDFIIYGKAEHYQNSFCIVDNVEVEYATDIDKWCYAKDLLELLKKTNSYK